ncbi:MAG: PhnD/SsuA/transferrin family substrate-binding protein, partial [Pseudomonadota bacterium]
MIASLGMYDFGAAQAANDRLWALIRDDLRKRGIAAPEALTRGADAYWPAWASPQLLLSQTCGYPFRARLRDQVTLVGTPDYGLPGAPPGHYYSVLVARKDDPRVDLAAFDGARLAYNEDLSQSGWAAPQTHLAGLGLTLRPHLRTGGHQRSAGAVADG